MLMHSDLSHSLLLDVNDVTSEPYRKSNKNDFIDAEAIAEAVTKQNMRFVQIKTEEQLDWQAMHRVRDRLMQRRSALINEIRRFLLERGLPLAVPPTHPTRDRHGG